MSPMWSWQENGSLSHAIRRIYQIILYNHIFWYSRITGKLIACRWTVNLGKFISTHPVSRARIAVLVSNYIHNLIIASKERERGKIWLVTNHSTHGFTQLVNACEMNHSTVHCLMYTHLLWWLLTAPSLHHRCWWSSSDCLTERIFE